MSEVSDGPGPSQPQRRRGPPAWRWWLLALLVAPAVLLGALLARAGPAPPPLPPPDETTLRRLAHDPQAIARGHALWGNCAGCHGLLGQGAQCPNLRDDAWLHGSRMQDLCRSITDGFPLKGMPAWGSSGYGMQPDDVQALAAYIASLHGSEDGSGKAPEGKVEPIRY
jgi:mono/diheme cytochrome c family protein